MQHTIIESRELFSLVSSNYEESKKTKQLTTYDFFLFSVRGSLRYVCASRATLISSNACIHVSRCRQKKVKLGLKK